MKKYSMAIIKNISDIIINFLEFSMSTLYYQYIL